MSVLAVHGVTVRHNGRTVLDRLDLALERGEILALVGPNGSGKTTALRVMAGLLWPQAGRVLLGGRDLHGIGALERAAALAYLPQDFHSHWDLTVEALLALGASRGTGFGWPGRPPAPRGNPAALDIDHLRQRRLSTLSGGERARAAIAWALAAASPILLADEPTAALDVGHQMELMRHLRRLKAATSILIVVHDLALAARFADRLAVLQGGRLVLCGPPDKVIVSPALDAAFGVAFHRVATPDGILPLARTS